MIKLSIVTVCRNSGKTIEKTIRSVLNQSYGEIEYLIIDGKSEDDTLQIIERYREHIVYIASEPDQGIYDAMNKGILASTGQYIAFMNSDDWYMDGAVEHIMKYAHETDADIIYGDYYRIYEDGRRTLIRQDTVDPEDIRFRMPICHQTVFAKRSLFQKLGLFELEYKIASDYDWLLRAYLAGCRMLYVSVPVCCFRLGGVSSRKRLLCYDEIRAISCRHLDDENRSKYLSLIDETYQEMYWNERLKGIPANPEEEGFLKQILMKLFQPHEEIILVGCGVYAEVCLRWMVFMNVKVLNIVDNDKEKQGTVYQGIEITGLQAVRDRKVTFVTASPQYEREMQKQLLESGIENIVLFSDIKNLIREQMME